MAKEKIEDISTEKLMKRKKIASFLIIILIAVGVLDIGTYIFDLIAGNSLQTYLLAPVAACILIVVIMIKGLNKVKVELQHRQNK